MATESEKTAANVHSNSYSIVAVVAGLIASVIIFAALLFAFHDGRNNIDASPTTLTNDQAGRSPPH